MIRGSFIKRVFTGLFLAAVMVFSGVSAARASDLTQSPPVKQETTAQKYAALKQELMQDRGIQEGFPRLGGNFEVIGEGTRRYNCIAHSLGIHDHWVNPETGPADAPFSAMDRMYARLGYTREKDLNWKLEKGMEKVVLYATLNPDGTINQVTHAAHQEADGSFTSKLGSMPLIRHPTPNELRGNIYGLPVAVYERPIKGNSPLSQ